MRTKASSWNRAWTTEYIGQTGNFACTIVPSATVNNSTLR